MEARSPLAGRLRPVPSGIPGHGPGVHLAERGGLHILGLAEAAGGPDFGARAAAALGAPLPAFGHVVRTGAVTVLGHAPGSWAVLAGEAADLAPLRHALPEAVVTLDGAFACLGLSGPRVCDLLAKGLPLDLDDPRHAPGRTFTSRIGKVTVTLYRTGTEAFDLLVPRSFAVFFLEWLEDAAQGIGLAVDG